MVCNGCRKKQPNIGITLSKDVAESDLLYGKYGNLNNRQIVARLKRYKKIYCSDKECRNRCDYTMFTECKKSQK